jgi:hypothetical protein
MKGYLAATPLAEAACYFHTLSLVRQSPQISLGIPNQRVGIHFPRRIGRRVGSGNLGSKN